MDLGAFLRSGSDLLVKLTVCGYNEPISGRLIERRKKPLWLSPLAFEKGSRLIISVDLPAYTLSWDDSLKPALPQSETNLKLLGQVEGCRFYQPLKHYVLRLKLLGRIEPS